jgi:hypothetical protein
VRQGGHPKQLCATRIGLHSSSTLHMRLHRIACATARCQGHCRIRDRPAAVVWSKNCSTYVCSASCCSLSVHQCEYSPIPWGTTSAREVLLTSISALCDGLISDFRSACSAGSQSLSSMAWAVSRLSQQPPQPWLQAFLQALQEDEALVRPLRLVVCRSYSAHPLLSVFPRAVTLHQH